jgi:hypothetical protein
MPAVVAVRQFDELTARTIEQRKRFWAVFDGAWFGASWA